MPEAQDKFKNILLHILSEIPLLKDLGEGKGLGDSFTKARLYTCGGEAKEISPRNLRSIFSGLAGTKTQEYCYEAQELRLEPFNFPKPETDLGNVEGVFQKFKADYKKIESLPDKAFANTCLALLEKYFCYVPCSIEGLEAVSLFDYIRSIAGFMVCLDKQDSDKEAPFLLVGGDVSGIQSFIYDIISTYASKNLKGRSFYLQLLVDSVIRKVLDRLELCHANIVYASGGGFYILAPNTKQVQDDLKKLEIEISDKIFQTHKTALSLVIAWEEVSSDTILKHELILNPSANQHDQKSIWDVLIQEINRKQKQKFKHQIKANFDTFFADNGIEVGGEQERDVITGEEISDNEFKDTNFPIEYLDKDEQNNPTKPIKYITNQQIELGKELKDFKFLVSSYQPVRIIGNHRSVNFYNPCDLGIHYCFLNLEELSRLDLGNNLLTIQCINNVEDHLLASFQNSPHTYTFSFYGGNDYPTIKINKNTELSKTFSEMAGQREPDREKEYGALYTNIMPSLPYKRLGVLRMDVDGLGAIFSGKKLNNLLKYSVLSRSLDYFFKGYLNTIWRENTAFRENTQIIYAGGDDLFIVGRWDYVIEFAEKIQEKFKHWTCGNEVLGISGGIAVVTPKFPINKSAEMSGEYEKKAKYHKFSPEQDPKTTSDSDWKKNSITLLGKPLHWLHEFPTVERLKNKFIAIGDDIKATSMKIQGFYDEKESIKEDLKRHEDEQTRKDHTPSWRWQLAYDIARTKDRYKNKKELKEFLDEIKIDIFTQKDHQMSAKNTDYEYFDLLAIAARWAELERRTKKESKHND